jgi:malate dehydrogenase (oxaloacetate-decarboxylating)(NADP+)
MSAQASVNIARNATTTKLLARVPPPAFSQATHRARCLAQLRSKNNNLEMYIYLNGLKDRDPSLFYSLLYDNMRESIPRFPLINVSHIVLAVHRKWSQSCTPQL